MLNRFAPLVPLALVTLLFGCAAHTPVAQQAPQQQVQNPATAQSSALFQEALYQEEKINGEDLHKILLAVSNLFEYLNNKYGDDEKLNEEVLKMTKTLYDPEVEKKGIEKGVEKKAIETAKVAIKKGFSNELIYELTGLTEEEINIIRQSISN